MHISPKAFQLLQLLLVQRPAAVSKQDLIAKIWPDVTVEEANLKVLISELRKALYPSAIRTVHRYGYAFAADAPRPTSARLLDDTRVHPLSEGENSIGRDPKCMVVLNSLGVSRIHAKVLITSDRSILHDLGSKNGTAVNGTRIQDPVELRDGDQIQIGIVTLTFRSHPTLDSTVSVT